ncbi:FAD-binding oxidoreductase [Muricauda oceani]|uniref:FAD-binding oxidoreductase n=1 Tax=Flagellimonas oceani TaxID=2698672 RepID=A0A6G7J5V9_9FLAO|nr:FAD-binding oxidoreductase [Allomuricauda oceani]MBW8244485.1 FAD-binding oxidoreductase [Allomuricauda oceani]QII45862.1 FAD-binding oxidoreductase [Allomuricauda oceani]
MVDYIVVGLGLAGISFCEVLEENGKTFKVITDGSQQASQVAGGLYNPVILKRFTMAWKAKMQLQGAKPFYQKLEQKLGVTLDYELPVLRKFASIEEQNLWFEASDRPDLDYFLSTKIIPNNNPSINAPHGFGEVKHTGRIDTRALIRSYKSYLKNSGAFVEETFDFDALSISSDTVSYKDIIAKKLVFATGFGLKQNPYFGYLPLNGTKGELLIIHAPDYKENNVIKSSVFTIPMENDRYLVGATYKWQDKTNQPTEESKNELLRKLSTFLQCDFEVVDHVAGIRPTVVDRRPLVGRHPEHQNLYVLNGFGSRGVMIGPYASKQLFDFIEKQSELDPEMDIQRFTKKYYSN